MDRESIIIRAKEYMELEENEHFRSQVELLIEKNDIDELTDRFYTDLVFGTGGLRGVIGGGYNRMNSFTIQRTTQGLANYINKTIGDRTSSVVIAYDSRNFSDIFALEAAKVLCGNGIAAYLFSSLRPTPELSFAVRKLQATAGIVITASHNTSEYNGYKVYWSDGAQIVFPQDKDIITEVLAVSSKPSVISREEAVERNLLHIIDNEVDDAFIAMVKNCAIRPDLLREHGSDCTVVFTPLHGSGAIPVERALREMGVTVVFVPEQKEPDGNFPTVAYPNPEETSAMKLALALAVKEKASLVIGTDPDADRLGVAVPDGESFRLITGNQLGALLEDYILSARKEAGTLPDHGVFVKTIVTTELQRRIADAYGVSCIDVLTGFKYIGEKIREFEQQENGPVYIAGGEESYGYLVNTEVRDKDAVSSATMAVEMALYYTNEGKTLFDRLQELWFEYGYFQEIQITKLFKGQFGAAGISTLMEDLRKTPPTVFAGRKVVTIKDYAVGTTRDVIQDSVVKDIDLPSSNVLQLILEDRSVITARPSGTEPKIKFYASCCSDPYIAIDTAMEQVEKNIDSIADAINGILSEA